MSCQSYAQSSAPGPGLGRVQHVGNTGVSRPGQRCQMAAPSSLPSQHPSPPQVGVKESERAAVRVAGVHLWLPIRPSVGPRPQQMQAAHPTQATLRAWSRQHWGGQGEPGRGGDRAEAPIHTSTRPQRTC